MMTASDLEIAVPGTGGAGDGGWSPRILVPVRSPGEADQTLTVAARLCCSAGGMLRLVHVRIFDPPVRGCGRFFPETAADAAAVLDEAQLTVWACGLRPGTAVVTAPRGEVAAAIAGQASNWPADLIVLTRRPRPAIASLVTGSVPDRVMRRASCPVLAVHPALSAHRRRK
jgi:nucleotide-binding universal stress UspA family protein